MSSIGFRSVCKHFRGSAVVDDLSFTVESGERVILFGPSGSGKTTILLLIAGLMVPDRGEILIDQRQVAIARRNLREPNERGIGMVFQDLALWPHMNVAANIEFALRAQRMKDVDRKRRVGQIAELLGVNEFLGVMPGELSGGEQQRVALARALVLGPRILLTDEPFSSLDEATRMQIQREILRLHDQRKFTLVHVTHNRAEAKELGNRAIAVGLQKSSVA